MSEIRFVNELGEALEEVATSKRATASPRPQRRRRGRWLRPRVVAVLAVLVVGGGVATAATLFDQSTTTLIAYPLTCESGTGHSDDPNGAEFYDVPQNGQSPTAACASQIGVPAATLVACARPSAGVVVYESDGHPDQCKSLGLTVLPARYSAANARIHALLRALTADYDRADCISPQQLAHQADDDLQGLGFVGWHSVIDAATGIGTGPCGAFPGNGNTISTAGAALDAAHHTVMIEQGAPRSIMRLQERVTKPMLVASGRRCYTLAGAQRLVHDMLDTTAGRTMPVRFAVEHEGSGETMGFARRQHYYDQGCTIVAGLQTAPDGHTFLVDLLNNAASPEDTGSIPVGDYRAVLRHG